MITLAINLLPDQDKEINKPIHKLIAITRVIKIKKQITKIINNKQKTTHLIKPVSYLLLVITIIIYTRI